MFYVMQILQVPPGNTRYNRSYKIVDISSVKYLDHEVGVDYRDHELSEG